MTDEQKKLLEIAKTQYFDELEAQQPSDEMCELCGQKMEIKDKQTIEYICMNPECDNYCKIPVSGKENK